MKSWKRMQRFPGSSSFYLQTVFLHAQSPATEGSQQFANLGQFILQSRSVIHDFRIGYRTLAKLDVDKINAIPWPTHG
jgi:homoserine acetyltransferase